MTAAPTLDCTAFGRLPLSGPVPLPRPFGPATTRAVTSLVAEAAATRASADTLTTTITILTAALAAARRSVHD